MAPVRFFCQNCSLMMKIGAQMAGHTVMCPQCGSRIAVPLQSDPQAEALYQFMKKKRGGDKSAHTGTVEAPTEKKVSSPSTKRPSAPRLQPTTARPPAVPAGAVSTEAVSPEEAFEKLEPDEVDAWIDEFWATVPETEHGFPKESIPHTLKRVPTEPSATETALIATRYRQTLALFRVWLLIVFLVGLVAGIYFHSVYDDFRRRRASASQSENAGSSGSSERIVQGTLYYPGFDGRPVPDADAVVVFLPLDRQPPAVPMSIDGLRPGDEPMESTEDGAQQITEFGGHFLRTGADGSFSLPLESAGRYLVLMISSHAGLAEGAEPDSGTIRELGRFFSNPKDLLGEYAFALDEYDFEQGKYLLRKKFP